MGGVVDIRKAKSSRRAVPGHCPACGWDGWKIFVNPNEMDLMLIVKIRCKNCLYEVMVKDLGESNE